MYIAHYSTNTQNQWPLITSNNLGSLLFHLFCIVDWWQPQPTTIEMWQRSDGKAAQFRSLPWKVVHIFYKICTRWHLSIWPEISIHIGCATRKIHIVKSSIIWWKVRVRQNRNIQTLQRLGERLFCCGFNICAQIKYGRVTCFVCLGGKMLC